MLRVVTALLPQHRQQSEQRRRVEGRSAAAVDAAEDESADDGLTADGRRIVPPLTVIANSNRTEHLQPTQLESLQLDLRAADLYNLILGRNVDACSDARQRPWMGRK